MRTTTTFIYFGLAVLALGQFAVLPEVRAVSPPPDGGYPGGNTAEGQNALQHNTSGGYNAAVGFYSLFGNTTGNFNTAVGAGALNVSTGNSNTATGAVALLLNTIGSNNTADGTDSLVFNNTGMQNTATGAFALYANTTGSTNIAVGYQAGSSLTTGNNNIDIGNVGLAGESGTIRLGDPAIHAAIFLGGITAMSPTAPNQAVLVHPATGQLGSADLSSFGVVITNPENTAVGDHALVSNTGGSNTAAGFHALEYNGNGSQNCAYGADALVNNGHNVSGGSYNDAFGAFALFNNIDGITNNAFGNHALFENVHASGNTAVGDLALQNNDSSGMALGSINTAVGAQALMSNTDGSSNNAIGYGALQNNNGLENNAMGVLAMQNNSSGAANVAVGDSAFANSTNGSYNTILGWQAGAGNAVNGDDNIYIGATSGPVSGSESETIRIGDPGFIAACYIAGIAGQTSSGGMPVYINTDGRLGTSTSSARFKDDIKPMADASQSIFALNPVTFRYKKAIDANGTPQFGLVAEEVAKVNPDLVISGPDGKPYTVRYEAVNAMLLNEFLKARRQIDAQQKQIDALAAGLQKVSAQVELSKSAPQTVLDRR